MGEEEPEECGTCKYCLDKPKNGGQNKLRQSCELKQQFKKRQKEEEEKQAAKKAKKEATAAAKSPAKPATKSPDKSPAKAAPAKSADKPPAKAAAAKAASSKEAPAKSPAKSPDKPPAKSPAKKQEPKEAVVKKEPKPEPAETKKRSGAPAAAPTEDRAKRQRSTAELADAPAPTEDSRPPAVRASCYEAGTVKPGSDGTLWRVVMDSSVTGKHSSEASWQLAASAPSPAQAPRATAPKTAPKATAAARAAAAAGSADKDDKKPLHPFVTGDTVEAIYKEGSWAAATVRSTARARQIQVEFLREQEETQDDGGPRCVAQEDETPRSIALRLGLSVGVVLQLNRHLPGLTAAAKLKQGTALLLPEAHVARENETPRAIAQQHGVADVEAALALNTHALPELQLADKLKAGTLLLLPRRTAEQAAAAAAAGGRKPPSASLPHLGEQLEVEVAEDDGSSAWKSAEVRELVSASKFSACVDNDEDFIEEYSLKEEGKEWRRNRPKPVERPHGLLPSVGDEVEVEVEEEGRTRWRRAEVRKLLPPVEAAEGAEGEEGEEVEGGGSSGAKLSVVVDGDEDFVEEYGQAEEGTEWRHVPRGGGGRLVQEWVGVSLVRPNAPVAPRGYMQKLTAGTAVQVWQDGLWWKATVQAFANADGSPFEPAEGADTSSAPTLVVQLLERPNLPPLPPLRVKPAALRPDWEYSPSTGWRLWEPAKPRPPPAPAAPAGGLLRLEARGFGAAAPAVGAAAASAAATRWSAFARGGDAGGASAAPAWARCGMEVEARLGETWLHGAWWAAQLLEVAPRGALLLFHQIAELDGSDERWQEWAAWGQVRPVPPPPPADFLAATRDGEDVELWWEEAWWAAALVSTPRRGLAQVRLHAPKFKKVRNVETRQLRPGWRWGGARWAAPCIAPPLHAPPPAAPAAAVVAANGPLDLNAVPAAGASPTDTTAAADDDESEDEETIIRNAQAAELARVAQEAEAANAATPPLPPHMDVGMEVDS